jgi:hypothetical protein
LNKPNKLFTGKTEGFAVCFFFGLYLVVGITAYRDYGISWDEPLSRTRGILALQYVVNGNDELLRADWKYHHGTAFEMALVAVEVVLGNTKDPKSVYLARHLATFLLFYAGVITFYRLGRHVFGSWKLGLLGSLFLVCHPRIFAHSFYNPKDIPFLSLFIISMYTIVLYLERKTFVRAILHGTACGVLMDVRVIGLLMPVLTFVFLAWDYLGSERGDHREGKAVRMRTWALASCTALAMAAAFLSRDSLRHLLDAAEKVPAVILNGSFLLVVAGLPALVAWRTRQAPRRKIAWSAMIFMICTSWVTTIFWPVLWANPVGEFARALSQTNKFPWPYTVLYMGQYYHADQLPWHYLPVWLLISTPVLYTVLFAAGALVISVGIVRNPLAFVDNRRCECICLICFLAPLLAAILSKAVIYDDWRQFYFVYPAFLVVGLRVVSSAVRYAGTRIRFWTVGRLNWGLAAILILMMIPTVTSMVRLHPFQNIYFGPLGADAMNVIRQKFEMDYWGLSYRRTLEYIVGMNPKRDIKICAANYPAKANVNMLDQAERERILFVDDVKEADYFVTNYRWHREEYRAGREVFSVTLDGAKIASVYKLEH